MPLAHSTENYLYGKGRLYFKPEGDNGYYDLGNVPGFDINLELEKLEHYSSRSGTKEKDLDIVSQKKAKSAFSLEEYSPENLNLAFLGDGIQAGSQSASFLDQSAVTVAEDQYVDVGKLSLSSLKIAHDSPAGGPFQIDETITGGTSSATAKVAWVGSGFLEVVNVSGTFVAAEVITGGTSLATANTTGVETHEDVVCVDSDTPTVRYTAGTDYDIDIDAGLLRSLSGGAITTTCYISADYAAKTLKSIRALANSSAPGALLFIGDPDQGPRWKVEGWDVNLSIAGGVPFIGEEIGAISMEAEYIADRTNHPTEPFFRATEIS